MKNNLPKRIKYKGQIYEAVTEGVAGLYSDKEYLQKINDDADKMINCLNNISELKEGDKYNFDSDTITVKVEWVPGYSPRSEIWYYTNNHLNSGGTNYIRNFADLRFPMKLIDDLKSKLKLIGAGARI